MSISKRALKDGSIRYDVQETVGIKPSGKPNRVKVTCRTMREARAVQAELRGKAREMTGPVRSMKLATYVEEVWSKRLEALSPTTRDTYRCELRIRILPALGSYEMRRISRPMVESLASSCRTRPVAKKCIGLLKTILNRAIADGYLESNPAALVDLPKGGAKRDNGLVLSTFREIERALDVIDAEADAATRAVANLGMLIGLRPEERYGMDCECVDTEGGWLHVRSAYVKASRHEGGNQSKSPKTELSERKLPLGGRLLRTMEELKGGRDRGPLILGSSGSRISPSTAQHRWRRFLDAHPEVPPVTIENMRHSFATAYLHEGGNVEDLSRILGHSDIVTTLRRYVRPKPEDLRAGVARYAP